MTPKKKVGGCRIVVIWHVDSDRRLLYGPFESHDEAQLWAAANLPNEQVEALAVTDWRTP